MADKMKLTTALELAFGNIPYSARLGKDAATVISEEIRNLRTKAPALVADPICSALHVSLSRLGYNGFDVVTTEQVIPTPIKSEANIDISKTIFASGGFCRPPAFDPRMFRS